VRDEAGVDGQGARRAPRGQPRDLSICADGGQGTVALLEN
jgi:hypothetical protein